MKKQKEEVQEMEWQEVVLLILVGFGGGFVQRVSGFGLGIFVMMFLPHFIPSHTAAATISTLFSCGTSVYNAVRYRKEVAFKTVLPMLAAALVTIPVAVWFSSRITAGFFELLLGIVLILLSLYFLFFNQRIHIKPSLPNGILSGTLSGIMSGLFSTGGPPVVLYLTHAAPDNAVYFATIQFYFAVTNVYGTVTRIINGFMTREVLILTAIGLVGCMAGNFIGGLIFKRLDTKKLKLIIYLCMIVSGVLMLL